MTDGRDRRLAAQAALIARIPNETDLDRIRTRANELAREWAPDPEYLGCTLLMLIRGADVEFFSAMRYRAGMRGETHTIELPRAIGTQPGWQEGDVSLSGRLSDVTAWRKGWAGVIESCVTEIGLSLEARVWIAVDADHDRLTFRVDADGPERSWQRNLYLVRGVLTDAEYGEIWNFGTDHSA